MIDLIEAPSIKDLEPKIQRVWDRSAEKIDALEARYDPEAGAPVFTVAGCYTARGWTEWTQGFQVGSALLQFDATGDERYLAIGRSRTVELMASHVTHLGVHDHGFNNVSTYGTLLRLMRQGRIADDRWERNFYELALKCSGAVQASRWTDLADGQGYICSFNGPHSLFSDTVRSLRALALGHALGHVLMGENDRKISLLDRLIGHAATTAKYNVYYGETPDGPARDGYDIRGRVVHESIFNVTDGRYRCPSTQQGYSAFSTWTRGLAWILCGYPEQLEFLDTLCDAELEPHGGREAVDAMMLRAATATADFYLEQTPTCGVPYWDTGAPGLAHLGDYLDRPADPFNDHEPVDSSAAAIAAQGLLRLGRRLGIDVEGRRYWQAGLRIADTIFSEPYLSTDPTHEGLLLHSVYHWPNRWDHVPAGRKVACGESSMWGDYHARELALYLQRIAHAQPYLTFFWPPVPPVSERVGAGVSERVGAGVSERVGAGVSERVGAAASGPSRSGDEVDAAAREDVAYSAARASEPANTAPANTAPANTAPANTAPANTAALVTGGTRGIGLGIATQLAADGFDVVLCGRRSEAEVEPVLAELRHFGRRVFYIPADIGSPEARAALLSGIRETVGTVNVLVNNAGVAPARRSDLLEATEESFDRLISINLKGPYFLTQAVARDMVAKREADQTFTASIVFVTSVSATLASPERGEYCVSKAGLSMAAQLWAVRLAAAGIPVYEVRPGVIRTDMTSGVTEKYDRLIGQGLIPQHRWGTPEDVGRAVAALARGDFPYSTGQVLMVDGGMTLGTL